VTLDAEVTLETNPETVTPERAAAWLEAGVTRLSLGVQSFDDAELARLGRAHSVSRVHDALRIVREAGCRNLSFDLMLWLPGQTRASWSRTVETAAAVGADHLSLYLLELYPNAPLKEAMARVVDGRSSADAGTRAAWAQAAEDDAADMYLEGLEILDRSGYAQYEISNVARAGFESRHNLKYWQSGAWRGFGCAAHSTLDGMRWRNVPGTVDYIERILVGRSPGTDVHVLQPAGRAEEALFTGMRLSAGIDGGPFAARFGFDPWERFGASLQEYIAMGLVWRDERRFGLTRRGMLVANDIFITFLGPAS
jgi:oxygen-independent coproporphyrinogen-3 oxidase